MKKTVFKTGMIFLAAIVVFCSCSSSKKVATNTTITEQSDATFQQTRQFDLSISRLVASTDSSWLHIVIFDTSLPIEPQTGLPPIKAYIEKGQVTTLETADTAVVQFEDTTTFCQQVSINTKQETRVKKTSVVTEWRNYLICLTLLLLIAYFLRKNLAKHGNSIT